MLSATREATATPFAGAQDRLERNIELRIAAGVSLVAVGTSASKSATAASLSLTAIKTIAVIGVSAAAAVTGYQTLMPAPQGLPATTQAPDRLKAAVHPGAPNAQRGVGSGPEEAALMHVDGAAGTAPNPVQPQHALAATKSSHPPGVVAHPQPLLRSPLAPWPDQVNSEDTARHGAPSASATPSKPSVSAIGDFASLQGVQSAVSSTAPIDPLKAAPIDPLKAEAQALRSIQLALRDGDGSRALHLLAAAAGEFPGGALGQERAAARIQALCLLRQVAAAKAEASAFVARWPGSPLRARVETSCQ
jgi:hypothetical protein